MAKSKEMTEERPVEDPALDPEAAEDAPDRPQTDGAVALEEAEDGSGEDVPDPEAAQEEVLDPLAKALQEAENHKDRWLRLAAEFENYKKRVARDYEALVSSAAENIIRELLPTLDAVGRAQDHGEEGEPDSEAFQEGMRMIMEQFPKVLQSRGLEEIAALGTPFDPHVHEALMQMPSEDHEAGLVSEVVERGYTLGGKVIRPSKVVVSLGKPVEEEKHSKAGKGKKKKS